MTDQATRNFAGIEVHTREVPDRVILIAEQRDEVADAPREVHVAVVMAADDDLVCDIAFPY